MLTGMTRPSAPRRGAASAGVVVALTAGALTGLVAADVEATLRTPTSTAQAAPATVSPVAPPAPATSVPATPAAPDAPALSPAPAPQSPARGQTPHTTTRAS